MVNLTIIGFLAVGIEKAIEELKNVVPEPYHKYAIFASILFGVIGSLALYFGWGIALAPVLAGAEAVNVAFANIAVGVFVGLSGSQFHDIINTVRNKTIG